MQQSQNYFSINPFFINSAVKQRGVSKSVFIESNVHFILQLATVYLVKKDADKTTDKLTEVLLNDLIHDTLKANFVNESHLEPLLSKEALSYSPQLWRILSLDERFPIEKLADTFEVVFNIDSAIAFRMIWASWARSIYRDHLDRFVSFAEKIMNVNPCNNEEETALIGIHAIEKFCQSFRLPMTLEDLDPSPTDTDLAELSNQIVNQESIVSEKDRKTIRTILAGLS